MQIEAKFYERLHTHDSSYGAASYDIEKLVRLPGFDLWLNRVSKSEAAFLEVGCGKGHFVNRLTGTLRQKHNLNFSRIAMLDLVRAEPNVFDSITPKPDFQQQSVDGQKLPYPDASFDLITCNHVLEHVFETEKFLREMQRVAKPGALVVIGVPNAAAWMNRVMFLFGGQPLGTEVGTERITYGFWPGFLKHKLTKFMPSGHIRDFTPRSLRDLTEECGLRFAGWWAQNGGFIPTLTRDLGILLEPVKTGNGK